MKTLRRLLLTTSLAAAACGVASANSIDALSTPTTVSGTTDYTYSLSLPEFDPGVDGVPATAQLTGATIYFFAEETVSTLTLTNTASGVETFTFVATSDVTSNSSNSANSADKYGTESLSLFSQSMTLGGTSNAGTCPDHSASATCNSVSFTPPALTATNLTLGFPTGTGGDGLTGVTKTISGADLANYIGSGDFNLGGSTKAFSTFAGGGGNINVAQSTTAAFSAEIDYTYSIPSGTPEPATMALMGGALIGLSLLGRRFKKS